MNSGQIVCPQCGSDNVWTRVWINLKNNSIEEPDALFEIHENYCEYCKEFVKLNIANDLFVIDNFGKVKRLYETTEWLYGPFKSKKDALKFVHIFKIIKLK